MTNIAFIGMGNMAQAIAGGFIKSACVKAENLFAYAPNQEKLKANAAKIGFNAEADLYAMVNKCDTVIIACKPYQIKDILSAEGGKLCKLLKGKALLSVAAGWVHSTFHEILGDDVRIQCIMPNTPALVGEGVMLFEKTNSLTAEEHAKAVELFQALGIVEELPTNLMGIGGAISGCGPAFMDLIMEAYADAAVKYGIARPTAYKLVAQTMLGSAKLQQVTGDHPGVLKDAVCSPNGTTIRGVDTLEKKGLRAACISSIDSIMEYKK
ncbi:MAG: pyrroline-5-carboxylate reductase [Treponema sp.]|nr:pyrroline-5-carboxylate reductase [Treponema sp.]